MSLHLITSDRRSYFHLCSGCAVGPMPLCDQQDPGSHFRVGCRRKYICIIDPGRMIFQETPQLQSSPTYASTSPRLIPPFSRQHRGRFGSHRDKMETSPPTRGLKHSMGFVGVWQLTGSLGSHKKRIRVVYLSRHR